MRGTVRRHWVSVTAGVVLVVILVTARLARFWTDVLWFRSMGFGGVFWKLLGTRTFLGIAAGIAVALLVGGNIWLARRLAPTLRHTAPSEEGVERLRTQLAPYSKWLAPVVGVFAGILAGLSATEAWPIVTLWANAQEFGTVDPQFGRDLGWFVFSLPFQSLLSSWLFGTLVLTVLAAGVAHYLFGGVRPQSQTRRITARANVHLSLLLAALVAVRAWGFALDQYLLSYSERGVVTGLSYTDVNAQLPAYRLLFVISLVCVALFVANVRFRGGLLPAAAVGILVAAAVILAGIYPAIVQRLRVDPQELDRERPYIEANLAATRAAYGLDDVDTARFPAAAELSPDEVADNADVFAAIRLWDPTAAQASYQQLQELRTYYEFRDVDVDRYETDQGTRQLLVSARELSPADLPSQSWQNRALVYTHGFGMVASSVSASSAGGQPVFVAQDLPPRGEESLIPEQPRLYFGENPPLYSIVGTEVEELDYASEEGTPQLNRYDGTDGVGIGSLARRLAFAIRFGEPNILLSGLLTDDSRVLYRRHIRDRVQALAPFLKYDHDAYPAVVDGRVVWIVDAYTTTDMVPYSQRVDLGSITRVEQRVLVARTDAQGRTTLVEERLPLPGITGRANYIRNAAKAVVDAYDGTVKLYVTDDEDPLIAAWRSAFPDLFTDFSEASEDLRRHFRYPEDMFRVQSEMYRRYHIPEADEFYTQEDAWRIPADPSFDRNRTTEESRPLRPTYQQIRLPGDDAAQFLLLQPYTPAGENRRNLIAYLAASSDPETYGELRTFLMPPTQTVFGPEQVLARVDQDEEISEERTLLGQSGSTVSYGNLLTIPVEDSLLYAVPLFIRAEQQPIPVLGKVILVFGDTIVMRDSLAEALEALFGFAPEVGEPPPSDAEPDEEPEPTEPTTRPPPTTGTAEEQVAELVTLALQDFAAADQALREGDLARYQELVEQARERLAEAQRLLGGAPAPTPTPTASPSP